MLMLDGGVPMRTGLPDSTENEHGCSRENLYTAGAWIYTHHQL